MKDQVVVYITRDKNPNFLKVFSKKPVRDNKECRWCASVGEFGNLSYKYPMVPWDECSDVIPGFEDLTWEDDPVAVELHVIKKKDKKDLFIDKIKSLAKKYEKEEGVPVTLRCGDDIWGIDNKNLVSLYSCVMRSNDGMDVEFYGDYEDEAAPLDHGFLCVDKKITYY